MLWRILGLCLLLVFANMLSTWLVDLLDIGFIPNGNRISTNLVMLSMVAYVVLLVIPFVPSVELGLALLVMAGPGAAISVYGCTVLGLGLAFLIGYCLPSSWLSAVFRFVRLVKAEQLIRSMESLGGEERLALILSRPSARGTPRLLRYRYLGLAVAVNLPGNMLFGGGGGISILAGLSRLFSPPAFLSTIMLAVAPLPMAILLFGHAGIFQ